MQELRESLKYCHKEKPEIRFKLDKSELWVNTANGEIFKKIFGEKLLEKFAKIVAELFDLKTGVRIYKQNFKLEESEEYRFLSSKSKEEFKIELLGSPFESNQMLTFYCPLKRELKFNDSRPIYVNDTHVDISSYHRNEPIIVENEKLFSYPNYELGDCSISHGFLFYSYSENLSDLPSYSLHLTLFDKDAPVAHHSRWNSKLFCKDWMSKSYFHQDIMSPQDSRFPIILDFAQKKEENDIDDFISEFI